jgi:hypothetical protein
MPLENAFWLSVALLLIAFLVSNRYSIPIINDFINFWRPKPRFMKVGPKNVNWAGAGSCEMGNSNIKCDYYRNISVSRREAFKESRLRLGRSDLGLGRIARGDEAVMTQNPQEIGGFRYRVPSDQEVDAALFGSERFRVKRNAAKT